MLLFKTYNDKFILSESFEDSNMTIFSTKIFRICKPYLTSKDVVEKSSMQKTTINDNLTCLGIIRI